MNTAILYSSDGFDTSRQKLMGRHAAGEGFIKAWASYSDAEFMYCFARNKSEVQHFVKQTRGLGRKDRKNVWIPWHYWKSLQKPGCLFLPGPDLSAMAYQRQQIKHAAFSLCGITHTTASDRVMDAIGDLVTAPTQPWDALICTSRSVRNMVQVVIDAYGDHLRKRFGMSHQPGCPIKLPVIPLGVDCAAFALSDGVRAGIRKTWRTMLGIEEHIVFLYMGRLSFHAKVHPMPIFRGLEVAAKKTGKSVCLIMAGWFANDSIKDQFLSAAREYCPSVKVIFLDGRKKEVREKIWFAADAFTSLSDNIQETFGLTPIEAMAAGLPVVASDWDGYRETIRNGIDGFLIPTWMGAPGHSRDLALLNASGSISYDEYIGCQSQFTAVNVDAAARAYIELVENEPLRNRMALAARERAKNTYDWAIIVRAYKELFSELEHLRMRSEQSLPGSRPPENPLRQDPTQLFRSYPSEVLATNTRITATEEYLPETVEKLKLLPMNGFALEKLQLHNTLRAVVASLVEHPQISVADLRALTTKFGECTSTDRAVLWLAKMGAVRLERVPMKSESEHG